MSDQDEDDMEKYFDIWLNEYMAANGLRGDRQGFGFDALEAAFDAGFDQSKENLQALIDVKNKELAALRKVVKDG